jgi:hypothetical protein
MVGGGHQLTERPPSGVARTVASGGTDPRSLGHTGRSEAETEHTAIPPDFGIDARNASASEWNGWFAWIDLTALVTLSPQYPLTRPPWCAATSLHARSASLRGRRCFAAGHACHAITHA